MKMISPNYLEKKPLRYSLINLYNDFNEKEIIGDIWDFLGKASAIIIPTNCFITNGKNVLGAGLAKEALRRYPEIDSKIAQQLTQFGKYPFIIKHDMKTAIISFPVKPDYIIVNKTKNNVVKHAQHKYKPGDKIPGFHSIGSLSLIRSSAKCLREIILGMKERWEFVVIPKIGTGYGELKWDNVKTILKDEKLYQMKQTYFISKE